MTMAEGSEVEDMSVLPPATLEGWYALHQVFAQDWSALHHATDTERARIADEARTLISGLAAPSSPGWSAVFQLIGGGADWMLVHFRETPEELGGVELRVRRSGLGPLLQLEYDYMSVTEAGLYHTTAEAAERAEPGSKEYRELLGEMTASERESPHLQKRLYPEVPEGMQYVSFYPMTKRRVHPDNWYTLPVAQRSGLMREHGMTGRRYAGRIFQIITGSVGLDDWEWGVTLFARDLLDVKRIVTDMRYDEASSRYGEFGTFYTGVRLSPEDWGDALLSE